MAVYAMPFYIIFHHLLNQFTMTQNEEVTGLVVIIMLIALLYIGHNFLGNIKAAPITLVPSSTASAQVQAATANTALAATQSYNSNVGAQAAAQNSAFGALGAGLGALAGSLAGGYDTGGY